MVNFADFYASKTWAALDGQRRRDFFDVKLLMDNEGFTDDIGKALLVYIICRPRTISELLRLNFKDIAALSEG